MSGSTPAQVRIGFAIVDITAIDDRAQTLTIDSYVRLSWVDPRLASLAGCRVSPDAIWNPRVQLLNAGTLGLRQPPTATIGEGGEVEVAARFFGDLSSAFDLTEFPFDNHVIELDVMTPVYTADEIQLGVDERWTFRRPTMSIPDWEVGAIHAVTFDREVAALGDTFSVFRLSIPIERRSNYYLYRLILPTIMIVMMSLGIFWVPSNQALRVSIGVTCVLTLFAFQFAVVAVMPRVSYLTTMDLITLASSLVVFLVLLEAFTVAYLVGKARDSAADKLDLISRVVFPVGYWVVLAALFA
ncbi:MAG: hypothetical protein O7E57_06655 [Gammaproteobacteria bacterium]|nr:hypothetical protein [Gammaproteobacteria bacterium]